MWSRLKRVTASIALWIDTGPILKQEPDNKLVTFTWSRLERIAIAPALGINISPFLKQECNDGYIPPCAVAWSVLL